MPSFKDLSPDQKKAALAHISTRLCARLRNAAPIEWSDDLSIGVIIWEKGHPLGAAGGFNGVNRLEVLEMLRMLAQSIEERGTAEAKA